MPLGKLVLSFAFSIAISISAHAQSGDVNGIWLVEAETAKVEIYDCDTKKCGKIVWLKEPFDENGNPKTDIHNPDKSKKNMPLLGTRMIWDMVADGPNKWDDGTIYRASDGKEFASKMELENANTLNVSGCVLFICPSQVWTRSSL